MMESTLVKATFWDGFKTLCCLQWQMQERCG